MELLLSSLVEPGGLVNTWEFKILRGIYPNALILSLRTLFFPSKAPDLAKETRQLITFSVPYISGNFTVKSLVWIFSKVCDTAGGDKGFFKSTHWNVLVFMACPELVAGWSKPIILSSRFQNLFLRLSSSTVLIVSITQWKVLEPLHYPTIPFYLHLTCTSPQEREVFFFLLFFSLLIKKCVTDVSLSPH